MISLLKYTAFLVLTCFLGFSCKTKPVSTSPDTFKTDTRFKVVGYLLAGNFDEIDSIELERITHLCLAFANPDVSGKLVMDREGDMEYVVQKAHKAGVKVLISLAGGGKQCEVKLFFRDDDGDGFGALSKPYHSCEAPKGYVANSDDKDDLDRQVH